MSTKLIKVAILVFLATSGKYLVLNEVVSVIQLISLCHNTFFKAMDAMCNIYCHYSSFYFPYADCEILDNCEPIQYLKLGKRGIIECSFGIHLHAIVWYDSVDTIENDPIANCVKVETLGDDCASEGYDVDVNGSLIISQVSLYHERTFTALQFMKNTEEPITHHVKIIVTGECIKLV